MGRLLQKQRQSWSPNQQLGGEVCGDIQSKLLLYLRILFSYLFLYQDVVLCRVRAYDAAQLASYVVNGFEAFFRKKLLDTANGRRSLKTEWLRQANADIEHEREISNNVFDITVGNGNEYIVDLTCGICSCFMGSKGQICKHVVDLSIRHEIELPDCLLALLSPSVKQRLSEIATGSASDLTFFAGLTDVAG